MSTIFLMDRLERRRRREKMSLAFRLQLYIVHQTKVVKKTFDPTCRYYFKIFHCFLVLNILKKNVCCVSNSSNFPVMSCFKHTQQNFPLTTSPSNTILFTHRLSFPCPTYSVREWFYDFYTLFYFHFCAIFLAPLYSHPSIYLHYYSLYTLYSCVCGTDPMWTRLL